MKYVWYTLFVVLTVMFVTVTVGCGGMGGQGVLIDGNENCPINITITDGGTDVAGNPSVALPEATTQPTGQE